MASAVYSSYDVQVNDASSCDFSGTAEKKYVLIDGGVPEVHCLIKDNAAASDICGSMEWTCYSQNYADVRKLVEASCHGMLKA